ncbi:prepilin-type N-terminal cleavage/methylation domain-containing protein [candidate division KSB1 bacterium]|nr:prepilin-type N-terminal cleavage/methylation domain-containing protein [candidate division KSB1 bacterium]
MRFKCCARIRGCVRGNERGFTIVEMMMVMFMSAIVLIGIAVIVTGSHDGIEIPNFLRHLLYL